MNTYLQFGHGMMKHSEVLIESGTAKGVLLSPRDLTLTQIGTVANSVRAAGGEVLFDPQCFARDIDHDRLTSYEYWKAYKSTSTQAILGSSGATEIFRRLLAVNVTIGSSKHILPGVMANPVTDAWFAFQERMIEAANNLVFGGEPIFATIALSKDSMLNEAQIEAVVEKSVKMECSRILYCS